MLCRIGTLYFIFGFLVMFFIYNEIDSIQHIRTQLEGNNSPKNTAHFSTNR